MQEQPKERDAWGRVGEHVCTGFSPLQQATLPEPVFWAFIECSLQLPHPTPFWWLVGGAESPSPLITWSFW